MIDTQINSPVPSPWMRAINFACIRFLRSALWRQGAASNDIIDSLAAELTSNAEHHVEWAVHQRGDAEVVERAIDYLTAVHDGPWKGAAWFAESLDLLMELAVPYASLDENAAAFLLDIQRGAGESYQSAPIPKSTLRITDEIAADIKTLQEAGCKYGLVSEILNMNEAIFHGEPMSRDRRDLLLIAATAAPFVRRERIDQGIDK